MEKTNICAFDGLLGCAVTDIHPHNAQGGRLRCATDVSSVIYPTGLPTRYSVARTWVPLSTILTAKSDFGQASLATVESTNLRNRDIYLQTLFIAPDESIFLKSLHARKRCFTVVGCSLVIDHFNRPQLFELCGEWSYWRRSSIELDYAISTGRHTPNLSSM
jgi:hypothetical protein